MYETYFISGCTSVLGQALVQSLVSKGYCMIAADMDRERLQEIATKQGWPEHQVAVMALDVRSESDWHRCLNAAVSRFGKVECLINLARYAKPGPTYSVSGQELSRHLDVNAKGTMLGTLIFCRYFKKRRSGHVVNFADEKTGTKANANCYLYHAAILAVRGFTAGLAKELRPYGVFATVVDSQVGLRPEDEINDLLSKVFRYRPSYYALEPGGTFWSWLTRMISRIDRDQPQPLQGMDHAS